MSPRKAGAESTEEYLDYQREYYRKKRKEILAKKRDRYHQDQKYREAALKRSQLRHAEISAENRRKSAQTTHAGKVERTYRLTQVGPLVNRSYDVLKKWRLQKGRVLPAALYKSPTGYDLYSESQVRFLAEALALADTGKIRLDYRDLGDVLTIVWEKTYSRNALNRAIKEVRHGEEYKRKRAKEDAAFRKKQSKERRAKLRKVYGKKK